MSVGGIAGERPSGVLGRGLQSISHRGGQAGRSRAHSAALECKNCGPCLRNASAPGGSCRVWNVGSRGAPTILRGGSPFIVPSRGTPCNAPSGRHNKSHQEMTRKTYVQGRTIGHILWCAAAPDRVSWQWNALIVRRTLPPQWLILMPAGTSTNESLHAEFNRCSAG